MDEVLYLQRYKEGWKSGEFVEKRDFRECIDPPRYRKGKQDDDDVFRGWFWDYPQFGATRFRCLSVQVRAHDHRPPRRVHHLCLHPQGSAWSLKDLVLSLLPSPDSSLMLDRAEQVLHDWFGDENYWAARRSMRFSPRLVEVANQFRKDRLNSDDGADGTIMEEKWEDQQVREGFAWPSYCDLNRIDFLLQPTRGSARGGPYLCAHLRRKDYVHSRAGQIPSLEGAAEQLVRKLTELGLDRAFVATDAPSEEFEVLRRALAKSGKEAERFRPDEETLRELGDGGVAIVDQIICSRARYVLVGSVEGRLNLVYRVLEFLSPQVFPRKRRVHLHFPHSGGARDPGL